MAMTTANAVRVVRSLARQDCEDDERREAADSHPGQQIAGWRAAARQAGDQGVIDAIDALGIDRAQEVYDAARAAVSA